MAMVDVDGGCQFSADSQLKSIGLVWGSAASRRSGYIHQMNRVNSRNDFGHDNSTINIVVVIILLLLLLKACSRPPNWTELNSDFLGLDVDTVYLLRV